MDKEKQCNSQRKLAIASDSVVPFKQRLRVGNGIKSAYGRRSIRFSEKNTELVDVEASFNNLCLMREMIRHKQYEKQQKMWI